MLLQCHQMKRRTWAQDHWHANGKFLTNPIIDADNTPVCTIIPKKDVEDAIAEQRRLNWLVSVPFPECWCWEKAGGLWPLELPPLLKIPRLWKRYCQQQCMPADSKVASTDAPVSQLIQRRQLGIVPLVLKRQPWAIVLPPRFHFQLRMALLVQLILRRKTKSTRKRKDQWCCCCHFPLLKATLRPLVDLDVPASNVTIRNRENLTTATDSKDPKPTNIPPDGVVAAKIEPSQSTNNETTPSSSTTRNQFKSKILLHLLPKTRLQLIL